MYRFPTKSWLQKRIALSEQDGVTLVEVLVASILLATGIATSFGVLDAASGTNIVAQRHQGAIEIAQREMEKIADLDFNKIGLTSSPQSSTDVNNPLNRVNGNNFLTENGQSEPLVVDGLNGVVNPGPESMQDGSTDAQVYRFVTWVDAPTYSGCTQNCDTTQDYKRITVAVKASRLNSKGFDKYVAVSTLRIDPYLGPLGKVTQPPDPSPTQAHNNFYLYDMRNASCSEATYSAPSSDHVTHDTRGHCGSASSNYPDLMGIEPPPNLVEPSLPPFYKYSTDLSGEYSSGLAIQRGNDCSLSGLTKYQMHSWTTPPISDTTYQLTGKLSFDFWSAKVGGVPGSAKICVWLYDRLMSGGWPGDTLIGSSSYTRSDWPTNSTNLSFTFSHDSYSLSAGHRLRFVLAVSSESSSDLSFIYDHPTAPSFIQVRTTTPVTE